MIGRLSSAQLHQGSLDVILDAQARLQRTQEELASGKRILSPSDDPVSTARISVIQSELSRIETYQRNADFVLGDLQFKEDTIASIERLVQRAKELALQGNNAALGQADKRAIAGEIEVIRGQLLSLSRTKNANGDFIFSGSRTDTAPFNEVNNEIQYVGDALFPLFNLGPGIALDTSIDTQALFGTTNDSDQSLFESLETLSSVLSDADTTSADLSANLSSVIDSLSSGLERVTTERASLGVRMNRVDDQVSLNDSFNLRLKTSLSGLQDLDYAKAISEMNLQMVALEAAQKAYTNTQGLSLFNYL